MSSTHETGGAVRADTTKPVPRRTIATYENYAEAEQAIEQLAKANFPVEHTQIIGRGLKMVERVTGRLKAGELVLRGAASGAISGLLIGWLFGLFDWFNPLIASAWLAFDGLWVGAIIGAVIGFIGYLIVRGRRDFGSVSVMTADRYDVVVDEPVADQAIKALATATTATATT